MSIIEVLFWISLIPLVLFLLTAVYNYFTAPRLSANKCGGDMPSVSILIPARNEEENIEKCINSILKQSYKNFEIIVLDDNSEDATARLVENFRTKNVNLINGKSLPQNWLGKNWACFQLSKAAKGEILLFIDADVQLEREAVESAVTELLKTKSEMLSVFPTQIISSFGEYLIVPLMNWLLLNFLPMRFIYSSKNKSFTAANGQFILIRKKIYQLIGGHESLKNKIVEDMELARKLKVRGFRIITLLGAELVYCRMYKDFKTSFLGFSKNFYFGFNNSAAAFIMLLLFIEIIFLLPLFLLFAGVQFLIPVLIIFLSRLLVAALSRQNIIASVILHPIQMFMLFIIGISSVFQSVFGGSEWKGRQIS